MSKNQHDTNLSELSPKQLGQALCVQNIEAERVEDIFDQYRAGHIPMNFINKAVSQAVEHNKPEIIAAIAVGMIEAETKINRSSDTSHLHDSTIHSLIHHVPVEEMSALVEYFREDAGIYKAAAALTVRSIMDPNVENHNPQRAKDFAEAIISTDQASGMLLPYLPVEMVPKIIRNWNKDREEIEIALNEAKRIGKYGHLAAITSSLGTATYETNGNVDSVNRALVLAATPTDQVTRIYNKLDHVGGIIRALGPEGESYHPNDFPEFVQHVVKHMLNVGTMETQTAILDHVFSSNAVPVSFISATLDESASTIAGHLERLALQQPNRLKAIVREMEGLQTTNPQAIGGALPYLPTAKVIEYLPQLTNGHNWPRGILNDNYHVQNVIVQAEKQKDHARKEAILEALGSDTQLFHNKEQYMISKYGSEAQLQRYITTDSLRAMTDIEHSTIMTTSKIGLLSKTLDRAAKKGERFRIDHIINGIAENTAMPNAGFYPVLVKHANAKQLTDLLRYDRVTPGLLENCVIYAMAEGDNEKAALIRQLSNDRITTMQPEQLKAARAEIRDVRANLRDPIYINNPRMMGAVLDLNHQATPRMRVDLGSNYFRMFDQTHGAESAMKLICLASMPDAFVSTVVTKAERPVINHIRQLRQKGFGSYEISDMLLTLPLQPLAQSNVAAEVMNEPDLAGLVGSFLSKVAPRRLAIGTQNWRDHVQPAAVAVEHTGETKTRKHRRDESHERDESPERDAKRQRSERATRRSPGVPLAF